MHWIGVDRVAPCFAVCMGGGIGSLRFHPCACALMHFLSKNECVSSCATVGHWSPMLSTELLRSTPRASLQPYPSMGEAARLFSEPCLSRYQLAMVCTRIGVGCASCVAAGHSSGRSRGLRRRLFASPPEWLPSGRLGDATKVCRRPQPSILTLSASPALVLMEPFARSQVALRAALHRWTPSTRRGW